MKQIRDVRKLKRQYEVRNTPKKRLPAIAVRAVWEKVTKGRAGIRWVSVVEEVWKDKNDTNGNNELCYTIIPDHLQPDITRHIPMLSMVCSVGSTEKDKKIGVESRETTEIFFFYMGKEKRKKGHRRKPRKR